MRLGQNYGDGEGVGGELEGREFRDERNQRMGIKGERVHGKIKRA